MTTDWPRRNVPPNSVPVTTVPMPGSVKTRSTGSRGLPMSRGGGVSGEHARERGLQLVEALSADDRRRDDRCVGEGRVRAAARGSRRPRPLRPASRSAFVSATTARRTPKYVRICRCSSVCGIHPSSAATTSRARSMEPTPATMFFTKSSWPGTSTIPRRNDDGGAAGEGSSRWAKPRSMVMPRDFSSGRRSGSVPVSALISALLP